MIVSVYRNLRDKKHPLYSVMHRGRVIARVRRILLTDCVFKVREGGRQRVLRDKVKNFHAFVTGKWVRRGGAFGQDANGRDFPVKVKYNPYENKTFVINASGFRYDGQPIHNARGVLLNEHGCTACYTD